MQLRQSLSQIEARRLWTNVSFSIAAFYLLFYFANLPHRHWSDSEIWGVRQAQACQEAWGNYACSWKPLFNFAVGKSVSMISNDDLAKIMTGARVIWLVPGWLMIAFIWLKTRRPIEPLICFLASSLFLIDSSVARSDLLALPWIILHVALLTDFKYKLGQGLFLTGLIVSAATAALLTPKTAILFLCFIPLYLTIFNHTKRSWIFVFAGFSFFAILAAGYFLDVSGTARFFTQMFSGQQLGVEYMSAPSFQHVVRSIEENPSLSLVVFAAVIMSCIETIRKRSPSAIAAILSFIYMIGFPDKLPFFLSTITLLFLFLSARSLILAPYARPMMTSLSLISALIGIHWASTLHLLNNEKQKQLANSLHALMAPYKNARIVDSIGIATDRPLVSAFLGPGDQKGFSATVDRIKNERFEIIVETFKIQIAEFKFYDELMANYVEAANGVFVRSESLEINTDQNSENEKRYDLTREVIARLEQNFAAHLSSDTWVAILYFDEELNRWSLESANLVRFAEIKNWQLSCDRKNCREIRFTPFGNFFHSSLPGSFLEEFRFESVVPRLSPWQLMARP